jgi:hypothetical protein
MFDAKVDLLKNRLYITLGRVQKNQVKNSFEMVQKAAAKLEPGFTCVTRIIDTRDIDENDIAEIQKVQKMLADYGMSRVIRVGVQQGKNMMKTVGNDVAYPVEEAGTTEEAEQILDTWIADQERRQTSETP